MYKISNYDIGMIGERLVKDYFESLGDTVVVSYSKYDETRDLLINRIDTEVKTITPYHRFPFPDGISSAYTIPITDDTKVHRNQLSKCLNVSRLIFVRRSLTSDPVIRIYEAPPVGQRLFTIIQNSRDKRYVAGFRTSIMKELCWVTNSKDVEQLMTN